MNSPQSARRHGLKLLLEQGGLRSRFPGVGHLAGHPTGDGLEIDAGGQHHMLAIQRSPTGNLNPPGRVVRLFDARRPPLDEVDAELLEAFVIEGDLAEIQRIAQDQIAENTGDVGGIGVHQGDGDSAAPKPEVFSQGRAGETAADHHHPAGQILRFEESRGGGERGCGSRQFQKVASRDRIHEIFPLLDRWK